MTNNPPLNSGISINTTLCEGCGACIDICLLDVFTWNLQTGKARLTNPNACNFCGDCINFCMVHALRFVDLPNPSQPTPQS